jgi:hypothetical protein
MNRFHASKGLLCRADSGPALTKAGLDEWPIEVSDG